MDRWKGLSIYGLFYDLFYLDIHFIKEIKK